MPMSFNQIPISVRVPGTYVEIDNSKAVQGLSIMPSKVLLIGQKTSAGTAATGVIERVTALDYGISRYGQGSVLAHMVERFIQANQVSELYAIALADNGAGQAATATITVTAAPTASGTLVLYVGGRRTEVGITAGQTTAQVATAIQTALAANLDLIVTASAALAVVTLTHRHKGAFGNDTDLRHSYYTGEGLPTGLALTLSAFSGGSGNPSIQTALDAMADEWFTDLATPYNDAASLVAVETKLSANFGPLRQIDGMCHVGLAGTFATVDALGAARNSPHVSLWPANRAPSPPWEWAASWAGVCSYYAAIDPARPFQTLSLPGILPPVPADRYSFTERNLLLFDGCSTWRVDAGGTVVVERAITTYQTTAFGAQDPSYLDVETMKTLAFLRYDVRTFVPRKYPRHKLADDGTLVSRGQAVVTPSVMRGELLARFRLWEASGLVEDFEQFKRDLIVERDTNDPNRLNSKIPANVINGFRMFAGQIEFIL